MRQIFEKLPELIDSGKPVGYCTVIKTRGSTPQKPGSKLLIGPDLSSIGTLGGGCVEAEARRQAVSIMQTWGRQLLKFQLDDDYGWDDGLICGGQMEIFIDTPQGDDEHVFRRLQETLARDHSVLLAILVESDAGAASIGAKLLYTQEGETVGSLGSEALDALVHEQANEWLRETEPILLEHAQGRVFVEPFHPEPTLLIAGAGHVGQALTRIAAMVGFRVVVIDDRVDFASRELLPDAAEVLVGDIASVLANYPIHQGTYIVIVTRGHRHDEEALFSVIRSEARYIGMIGSRRKVKLIFDDLVERGIEPELIEQVHSPIGLSIHSQTVPEIAVSIAAQLILARRSPGNVPVSNRAQAIPQVSR